MRAEIRGLDFGRYLAMIRDFTRTTLVPAEAELDDTGVIPSAIEAQLKDLGLFAITLPTAYGGLGFSMRQQVQLTIQFTQTVAAFRSRFSTTIGLASQMLLDHGTEDQRRKYLPAMAAGECTGAAAVTEPEAGSDAGAVRTTAVRRGDRYLLNGHKRFITNASIADVLLVLARTDEDVPGARGTSMFVVPAETPGIRVRAAPVTEMLSWRGSPTCEVWFDQVEVPADAVLGHVAGAGLTAALRGFNHARTHIAATAVGQATRCLDEALDHSANRQQFGRPLAEFGQVQALLAEMYADLRAGRALVLEAAQAFDEGPIPVTDLAAAKYFCTEMAGRVADRAVQILGGDGIVGNHIVSRLFRDVRILRIGEGASQVLTNQIARRLVAGRRADGVTP